MEIVYSNGENAVESAEAQSFENGENTYVQKFLGVSLTDRASNGYRFRVYIPDAHRVELTGDFNSWGVTEMSRTAYEGVWECSVCSDIPLDGMCYKFRYYTPKGAFRLSDICSMYGQLPERDESVVCVRDSYEWRSDKRIPLLANAPINIVKIDLDEYISDRGERMNYRDIAISISDTATDMGYTHVLVSFGSAKRKCSFGEISYFFSPPAKFGRPEDAMYLVDELHSRGIGAVASLRLCSTSRVENMTPRERSIVASCIVSLYERFGFDGVELSFYTEKNKVTDSKKMTDTLANIIRVVREAFPEISLIAGDSIPLPQTDDEKLFDLYLDPDVSLVRHAITANNETKKYKYSKLNYSLMNSFEQSLLLPLTMFEKIKKESDLSVETVKKMKLEISYLMLRPGKKLVTEMPETSIIPSDMRRFLRQLTDLYLTHPSLWNGEGNRENFEWLCYASETRGVIAFVRGREDDSLISIFNFDSEGICGAEFAANDRRQYECIFSTSKKTGEILYARDMKLVLDIEPRSASVYRTVAHPITNKL